MKVGKYNPLADTREYISLPDGVYGAKLEKTEPDEQKRNSLLEVVNYNNQSDRDKEAHRHSWLVVSDNGIDGTAFLKLQLLPDWLTPEAYSVAFNKGNPVDETTQEKVNLWLLANEDRIRTRLQENPDLSEEQIKESAETGLTKLVQRIQINVSGWFKLQKAKGLEEELPDPGEKLDCISVVSNQENKTKIGGRVIDEGWGPTVKADKFWVPRK